MGLASVMEFGGSVGVGARVADTIRTKVVDTSLFKDDPAMLMLGMVCAVTASSIYLTFATRIGLPVSTTHSIMGGVIGMGVASVGASGVQWVGKGSGTGVINAGVVQVFLAWILAPGIAACFGAIIFLITKFGVMLRKNPVYKALFLVPIYFGITAALLTMLLLWKGGSYTVTLNNAEIVGTIIGVGAAWALVVAIFFCPWLYRKVIKDDWQLKLWHVPLGPLLLRRGDPPPPPADWHGGIRNYYEGHLTKEELEARRAHQAGVRIVNDEEAAAPGQEKQINPDDNTSTDADPYEHVPESHKKIVGPKPEGAWYNGSVLFWYVKYALFRGVDKDVVNMQKKKDILSGDVEEMHARAAHYNNKAEYMYSFLQVMTASTASFTHGANDISNAIGPYATIYQIWNEGTLPETGKSHVPIWILVFGGSALAIGLWTYGYNIMKNLGNRITLHSPSRGFSMELGSVITIVMATRLSKSNCIATCN